MAHGTHARTHTRRTHARARRYDVPLVADIHFQPQVAMMVAEAFEKIRINPGNFADGRKTFDVINYDDPAQFRAEQEHIREARARACACAFSVCAGVCVCAAVCRIGKGDGGWQLRATPSSNPPPTLDAETQPCPSRARARRRPTHARPAQTFIPLVEKCKRLGRAMRIGTNHGSLSARILSYYGDTPRCVFV